MPDNADTAAPRSKDGLTQHLINEHLMTPEAIAAGGIKSLDGLRSLHRVTHRNLPHDGHRHRGMTEGDER